MRGFAIGWILGLVIFTWMGQSAVKVKEDYIKEFCQMPKFCEYPYVKLSARQKAFCDLKKDSK